MFKRIRATCMIAAGIFSLASACGSDDRARQEDEKPVVRQARDSLPSVANRGSIAPVAPAVEVKATPPVSVVQVGQDEVLDKLALEAKKSPKARVALARALVEAGKLREARKHVESALDEDPSSSQAWNLLGRIELGARDLDAAVEAFQRATDEDPDSSYAWNNLGYTLIEQERFEEAAAALENATSGAKPTAYMWNNLGMAYEHIDRIREARAAYRQAAAAGSEKGKANVERLEGVVSLRAADPPDDAPVEVKDPADTSAEEATMDDAGAAGGPTQDPEAELGC